MRGFARHRKAFDPATEIEPVGLLACRNLGAVPYLDSDAEAHALMTATATLRPALHAATCHTLLRLLVVSGMRLSEVIGLDRNDLEMSSQQLASVHGTAHSEYRHKC